MRKEKSPTPKAIEPSSVGKRRRPRQARAKETMAAILEACERVAARDGFVRLETTRIAAAAGVSIGSLYQYFSSREAIALALYEDRSKEVALTMKAAMIAALDRPPQEALPEIMELILSLHEKHRLILHRMRAEMPQLMLAQQPISVDHLVRGSVSHYLRHQDATLTTAEVERKTFMVEKTVLNCIRDYLEDSSGIPRADFVKDLAILCARYLAPEPSQSFSTERKASGSRPSRKGE